MYWDIKNNNWNAKDWDAYRFWTKVLGFSTKQKAKGTIHNGFAYVIVYNRKKPSKTLVVKAAL